MAGELNGSLVLLLLKVLGQWRLIGGQVSMTDTIAAAPIDITNKSSQDYRELLPGEGLLTRDLTLELYYNSDSNFQRMRELANTGEMAEFRILRADTGVNDDVVAMVSSFSEVAPMSDRVSNTITLAGTRFSEAGPMPPIITLPPEDTEAQIGAEVSFVTRAINWTTVQWFVQRAPLDGGEMPPREAIEGATKPDLKYTFTMDDVGASLIVVYSNAYGSAEAIARLNVALNPVALTLLYPLNSAEEVEMVYDLDSAEIQETLGPQSGGETAGFGDYGLTSMLVRDIQLIVQGPAETAGFDGYDLTSMLLRSTSLIVQGPTEAIGFDGYGVTAVLQRDVIVDLPNTETATFGSYGITSMVIT